MSNGIPYTARKRPTCIDCGKLAVAFTDELSQREFAISGLCQACQDVAFREPDEDECDGLAGGGYYALDPGFADGHRSGARDHLACACDQSGLDADEHAGSSGDHGGPAHRAADAVPRSVRPPLVSVVFQLVDAGWEFLYAFDEDIKF